MQQFHAIWLSDVHLGTDACRADALLDFLSAVHCERLYLVGDIVDLERLQFRPQFPDAHIRVILELARLARRGTEVMFIPGNHDHRFRALAGKDILGIHVLYETVHISRSGRLLLVMHGDRLDGRIRQGTNLEKFGAAAYQVLTRADVYLNRIRRGVGLDHFSVNAMVKRRLQSARDYVRRFEQVALEYAVELGFDGIICGHIHKPAIIRKGRHIYANDGDWVEHGTALAESVDGELQLLRWNAASARIEIDDPILLAA